MALDAILIAACSALFAALDTSSIMGLIRFGAKFPEITAGVDPAVLLLTASVAEELFKNFGLSCVARTGLVDCKLDCPVPTVDCDNVDCPLLMLALE